MERFLRQESFIIILIHDFIILCAAFRNDKNGSWDIGSCIRVFCSFEVSLVQPQVLGTSERLKEQLICMKSGLVKR